MQFLQSRIASFCWLILLFASLTTGCAARFIADYDPVLDQNMTSLQQSTEAFLAQLTNESGTTSAQYSSNTDFYVKTQATLKTVETREGATPKSK